MDKFLTPIETATYQFLERYMEEVIKEQKEKNMVASGKSAKSLRIEMKGLEGTLYGAKYFVYQQYGRGPTKSTTRSDFFLNLKQWLKDRGLEGVLNIFAVYRKLTKEGSLIFRGKKPPLGFDKINDRLLPTLLKPLAIASAESFNNAFSSLIRQSIKRFNKDA